ncbi:MAG: sugar transferase [Verrucomicrobiota bacterium]|jgi:exopolysaccharide biosynthesis polyprenyl glycosylphosphotransferase
MLRRDHQIRVQVLQWTDGMVFALGLWLAHYIRFNWHVVVSAMRDFGVVKWLAHFLRYNVIGMPLPPNPYAPDVIAPFSDYLLLFVLVIPLAMIILHTQGFYDEAIFVRRRVRAWQLARACFLTTIGLILVVYLLMRGGPARGVIVLFGFCSFGLMSLKEELLLRDRRGQLGATQYSRRVVLVGERADMESLRAEMRKAHPELEVVGEVDLNATSTEQLVSFLHRHSVNSVMLSARHTVFGRIEEAIQACELEGIEAWLVADFFKTRISQTTMDNFCGRPMLVFHSGPQMASWAGVVKQFIDVMGALLLLVFALPLIFLPAAILIKLTSPGPVFFRQRRAGLNGRPFMMYKFRSMVSNAEQLKQELASLNEMSGPVFKVTNDPRVTSIGRFLRKFSFDEFPQLFNVLLGDMSLVGPRPLPVEEVNRFDDWSHRRRLSVKPGLTCLWQVGGRNEVRDFKEWVRLDLEYIDHWSLWLDFKILWRTIPVVLLGRGAR